MYDVRQILQSKGTDVVSVGPDVSVSVALGIMKESGIGALVVSKDGSSVDGVFSESDVVHGLVDHGSGFLDKSVGEVAATEILPCSFADSSREILARMTQKRVRHFPVIEDGKLSGIVSMGDVVKMRLEEIIRDAEALRAFAVGAGPG